MSRWIRQVHRWLSIAFTLTVIANFVVIGMGKQIDVVTYSPLLPLFLLLPVHGSVHVLPSVRHQVGQLAEGVMKKSSANWREETLDRIRTLINEADPGMIEERKWKKPSNGMAGIPVWSHDGIVCTGETYKNYVKVTFAKGAFVKDPSKLFNAGLEGNLRRAIDFREGDTINEKALKSLVNAAVKLNSSDRD